MSYLRYPKKWEMKYNDQHRVQKCSYFYFGE